MSNGANQVHKQLCEELINYIKSQYFEKTPVLLSAIKDIINKDGVLYKRPYIESSPAYVSVEDGISKSNLPDWLKNFFSELSQAKLGVYPAPFKHQIQALENYYEGKDLFVSTGTGSGKTECFMWPLIAKIVAEAKDNKTWNEQQGVRAVIMYPMNALVSDQISRLRKLLGDPENKFIEILRKNCGTDVRRPKFGMYTGRTPYPGEEPDKKQDQELAENLKSMAYASTDSEKQYLQQLKKEGKIPAKKNLQEFINKLSLSEHSPDEDDSELITRFEMQECCPDILITNYTMLEYMLFRPREKKIWDYTKEWLRKDSSNKLLFIIDEAHMYKGAPGGEIALLIRRFFHKLGITRDRVQFILTTASMPNSSDKDKQKVKCFAEDLTAAERQDTFVFLTGERQNIEGLQRFNIPFEHFHKFTPEQFENEHNRLEALNDFWSSLEGSSQFFSNLEQAYEWMFDNLILYRPFFKLVSTCRGTAVALDELADAIFPENLRSEALHAVSVMLAIAPLAKDKNGSVFFPARMHMLFRGLNNVYACTNPNCPHSHSAGGITLGKVFFSDGVLKCPECKSAVYELYQDRQCGALFFSGYVFEEDNLDNEKQYLWRNPGLIKLQQMRRINLYIPSKDFIPSEELKNIKPCYMDVSSGFINFSDDSLNGKTGFRKLYYSTRKPTDESPDFNKCPHCLSKLKNNNLTSFATKGNQSFFNLIKTQFQLESPIETKDPQKYPNQGRKVLVFSDSRQQAAKLALNMSEASEIMAARQLFALAIKEMEKYDDSSMCYLYPFFCNVTMDKNLELFHDDDKEIFKDGCKEVKRRTARKGEACLTKMSLDVPDTYNEYLLRLFCGTNNLYSCASCWIEPTEDALDDILYETDIKSEDEVFEIFNAVFLSLCKDELALDYKSSSIPIEVRQKIRKSNKFGLDEDWNFPENIEKVICKSYDDGKEYLEKIKQAFINYIFAAKHDGDKSYYINLEKVRPRYDQEHVWYKCERCSKITPFKLKNVCPCCGFSQIHELREDEKEALNFWRKPIQDAVNGGKIHIIDTEEHTAQLSYRDQRDKLLSKTEQYELRFQDLLKDNETPVDILSSTTTMEVGIDIGSLVAVGLRNIPPLRENYQQRAGRAGRRGASLSTIVTFCGNGPHDTLYFDEPIPMFRGEPRSPWIDISNEKIVHRHLNMIAIQEYLDHLNSSIDKMSVAEFVNHHLESFGAFINNFLRSSAPVILPKDAKVDAETFSKDLKEKITKIKRSLETHPEFYGIKVDGSFTANPKSLLDSLYEEGIIPTYSFPKNIVSMYISDSRGIVQYKIDRGLDLAISEFAPGKSLVIDKKNYLVGGLYYPKSELGKDKDGTWKSLKPAKAYLNDQNYVKEIRKCNDCKWFGLKQDFENIKTCPFCGSSNLSDDSRPLVKPWGFAPKDATSINESYIKESYSSSLPPIYSTLPTSDEMNLVNNTKNIRMALRTNQKIIMINSNNDRGFCICSDCGAVAPVQRYKNDEVLDNFERPYKIKDQTYSKPCPHRSVKMIDLGFDFITDMLVMEFRLDNALNIKNETQNLWLNRAAQSFAEALRLVACRELDVDFSELVTGYRVRRNPNETCVDIYLYDSLSSGAGYAVNIQDNMSEILNKIESYLNRCDCESACFKCLKHYRNQYVHGYLDRFAALDFLYWGRDGKIADELDFKSQVDLIRELENILNVSGYHVVVNEPHIFINYQNQTVPLIIYPSMMSKPEDNGGIYINKDLITYAKPEAIKAIISHFNITE